MQGVLTGRKLALVIAGAFFALMAAFVWIADAEAIEGPRKYKQKNGQIKNGWGLGPYPVETAYANKWSGSFVMCSPPWGSQSVTTDAQGAINRMKDGWVMKLAANRTCPNTLANSPDSKPSFQGSGWEDLEPQPDEDGWVPVHITDQTVVNPDTGRYINGVMYPKTIPSGYIQEDTDLWYNQNTGMYSYWDATQEYAHPGGNYNEVYLFEGSLAAQGLTSAQGYEILEHELGHAEGYWHGQGDPSTNPSYYAGYDQGGFTCGEGQADEAGVCGGALAAQSADPKSQPQGDVGSPESLSGVESTTPETTTPETGTPSEDGKSNVTEPKPKEETAPSEEALPEGDTPEAA